MISYNIYYKEKNNTGENRDIFSRVEDRLHDFKIVKSDKPEYVFTFGGDGTLLEAIHKYGLDVIYVGCNLGHLGYTNYFDKDTILSCLGQLRNYNILQTTPLVCKIDDKEFLVVNEVVVGDVCLTQKYNIFVDDIFFESIASSGVVVSSALGSTAYNKSLGGCIMSPYSSNYVLTLIAPINSKVYHAIRESVIFDNNQVRIESKNKIMNIYIDGKFVGGSNNIQIVQSINKLKILTNNTTWIEKLRNSFER